MLVSNSKEMVVLLSALKLTPWEYTMLENAIDIKITKLALMHAIVSSDTEVQHAYRDSACWNELTNLIKNVSL